MLLKKLLIFKLFYKAIHLFALIIFLTGLCYFKIIGFSRILKGFIYSYFMIKR